MNTPDEWRLEADAPSGWNSANFAAFVEHRVWRFAHTMPNNPHEYALRLTDDPAFDSAVRYIREHGCVEYFRSMPYKILYFGDHKFWTMGADLEETVLINRKNRDADQTPISGANHSAEITVAWSGPYRPDEVAARFYDEGAPPDYDGEDYGLYQIYGRHILCGPDTLLYVGKATEQTFSRRFRQHGEWLSREDDISIYLGRIYDPQRHSAADGWASWVDDVKLAECLLIYKYSPNYNSVSVSDPPSLQSYTSVAMVHEGNRHKLASRDSAPSDW